MKRGRLPEPLDKVILENLNLLMAEQFFLDEIGELPLEIQSKLFARFGLSPNLSIGGKNGKEFKHQSHCCNEPRFTKKK